MPMIRWILTLPFVFVLSTSAMAQSSSQNAPVNPQDEILKLQRAWLEAESKGDTATLRKLIDDEFIGTSFDGNILDKDDIAPPGNAADANHLPPSTLEDATVRMFGTTAVVMGRVKLDSPTHPGRFRFTMVYFQRPQGWKIVAAHLTRIEPQG
jgi:ketosteroid isomerase-like protein